MKSIIYSSLLFLALSTFFFVSCTSSVEEQSESDVFIVDSAYIAENFIKQEFMIPMRDGISLYTVVYTPVDSLQQYPIFMRRTPYSCAPYGKSNYPKALGPSDLFVSEGFIFVYQDVRGRFMSEGNFVDMRPHIDNKNDSTKIDESSDTYDTVDWLLKNLDNHNGKVGLYGISYPGFYAIAGAIQGHEAIKVVFPKSAIADWYFDDFHHHGAFFLPHFAMFYRYFGQPRPQPTENWPRPTFVPDTEDGYEFFMRYEPLSKISKGLFNNQVAFWDSIVAHPNYDDFWQKKSILPHLKGISSAVITVGGWFDAEDLYGPFHIYDEVEKNNPDLFNVLVVGPWSHGGMSRTSGNRLGYANFSNGKISPSQVYQERVELAAAIHFLKDNSTIINLPEALMYNTGLNQWREFNNWPPKHLSESILYFSIDNLLTLDKQDNEYVYNYTSDPQNPVPYTADTTNRMTKTYMVEDQRFLHGRNDVLSFSTPILNADITIAGKVISKLFVSLSETDADFVVKLIDVYPNDETLNTDSFNYAGFEQMIRSEVLRGRYRNSYENPQPFAPETVELVEFPLQDILHTFKKGHKIMVQIQSSWFPLVDINPQKYVENIYLATESDFVKQEIKLFCSEEYPSGIYFSSFEPEM